MTPTHPAGTDIDSLARELAAVERLNRELHNCVAAIRRLGECASTCDVLAALREILTGIIGSDDFATYLLEPDGALRWVDGRGSFGAVPQHFSLGKGAIGQAIASGTVDIPTETDSVPNPLPGWPVATVVPLLFGERILGGIAIFDVLPHRDPLTQTDRDVLHLLGVQAGVALAVADILTHEPRTEASSV